MIDLSQLGAIGSFAVMGCWFLSGKLTGSRARQEVVQQEVISMPDKKRPLLHGLRKRLYGDERWLRYNVRIIERQELPKDRERPGDQWGRNRDGVQVRGLVKGVPPLRSQSHPPPPPRAKDPGRTERF